MSEPLWISVRNWRKFQHYDPAKRRPVWIKAHLDLLSSDEYRDLSAGCRAALHGIWLEYASTQCQLKFDSKSLSTRLNLRVTKRQLEALVNAGFLDVVASTSLADGYQVASLEVEVEVEVEKKEPLHVKSRTVCSHCGLDLRGTLKLAEHLYITHDGPEPQHWVDAETKAAL